jgi:hypothetical protein
VTDYEGPAEVTEDEVRFLALLPEVRQAIATFGEPDWQRARKEVYRDDKATGVGWTIPLGDAGAQLSLVQASDTADQVMVTRELGEGRMECLTPAGTPFPFTDE